MNLENFLYLVHEEICSGIKKISEKRCYLKKPIFKGPNQVWYCDVDNYSPRIVLSFSHNIFSVEFNKLRVSSTDSKPDNQFNLFYKLASNENPKITEQFREELLTLYDKYLNSYIDTYLSRVLSKVNYYKTTIKESSSKSNNKNHKYFEEPNIKIYKIIRGSKKVRHKSGEGFWISVYENHTYEIIANNCLNDDVKIKKIKEYLKFREKQIQYEEEYIYMEKRSIEYSDRILDLEFSFMINNYDIEILLKEAKQNNFANYKNWITKEILVFYSFLFFGDVTRFIENLKKTYDKVDYWALYETYFRIYQSYLNRNTIFHFSNGFKDYSNDINFYLPNNYIEIEKEVYSLFNSTDIDSCFNNFIVNCNLHENNYVDVIESVYKFIKQNKTT
ncbi:hypothetical protein [Winogradskyella sediminis]|uniref:hypothetical protein n=1 Tax=Winogradskyella sediminis TaxID=1382466 RepID=UPI000E271E44|nr:hypothetical protein [Winogradskyella sediminis]REG83032.1 hypothetical protein C8N41_1161 [Winogradskyella sediminis]